MTWRILSPFFVFSCNESIQLCLPKQHNRIIAFNTSPDLTYQKDAFTLLCSISMADSDILIATCSHRAGKEQSMTGDAANLLRFNTQNLPRDFPIVMYKMNIDLSPSFNRIDDFTDKKTIVFLLRWLFPSDMIFIIKQGLGSGINMTTL